MYLYLSLNIHVYIYIYKAYFINAWIAEYIFCEKGVSAQRLRTRDPQVVAPGEGRRASCGSAEGPNAAPGATVNELRQPEAARTFTGATSFDRLKEGEQEETRRQFVSGIRWLNHLGAFFAFLSGLFLASGQRSIVS